MIRLLSSEILRFWSRRLVRVMTVVAMLGIVVAMVIAGANSSRPTQEQLDAGQQRYERRLARCIESDAFGEQIPQGSTVEALCREFLGSPSDYTSGGDQLELADLPEIVQTVSFVLILFGLVIGSSMVGASWQSGTITTILTWEPRRLRWFAARLVVAALGVFVLTVALVAFLSAAVAITAALAGSTVRPEGWLTDLVETCLRVSAVAAGASLLGATLAAIGRNTAAALGAVFVYLAVLENLVRGFRPTWGRYMLGDALVTMVTAEPLEIDTGGGTLASTPTRGIAVALLYLGVLVVVAAATLRVRDVN